MILGQRECYQDPLEDDDKETTAVLFGMSYLFLRYSCHSPNLGEITHFFLDADETDCETDCETDDIESSSAQTCTSDHIGITFIANSVEHMYFILDTCKNSFIQHVVQCIWILKII